MAETAATPRLKRIQTISLVLLVTAGVVNYVDRATLAVANPLIRQDLGLTIADMGLLLSAFLWAYAFSQLPAGALADRLGPRLTLTLGLTCWSLGQMLGATETSFWQFIGARIVLGAGEAPHFPTCARVSRDWFNIRQRGTATGIWNCASSLGSFIALPLLTFLMLSFGWRAMFVAMGGMGLALAAVVYTVFRNPPDADLTADEQAYLTEGDAPGVRSRVTWSDWRRLFAYRTTWGMIMGYFGCIYMTWLYTAWLPSYLEIERHFTIGKTGWVASIPFAFGVAGGVFGGRLVDVLARRGIDPILSRKIPMATSLVATALFTSWRPRRRATCWPSPASRCRFSSSTRARPPPGPWRRWRRPSTARHRSAPCRTSAGISGGPWPRPSRATSCNRRDTSRSPSSPVR